MRYLAIIFLSLFVVSCSSVPITGRKRLNFISDNELAQKSSQQYSEIISKSKLSTDQRQKSLLLKVGRRISAATEAFVAQNNLEMTFDWEFNLIEDKQVNAWAMPGGKIAFYTGIMPYLQTESELAAVMGHEVAHVLARHGHERMSTGILTNVGLAVLGLSMTDDEFSQAIIGATAAGAQVFVALPFSRKHEYEADELGAILMAMAGYDPRDATSFWEKMVAEGSSGPIEFLSTHPSSENRIERLQKMMPKALTYYRKSKNNK